MSRIEQFEQLLANGTDNAMLRFSLGRDYLDAGDADTAAEHLRQAVAFDADYSAAWKALGRALVQLEDNAAAADAYRAGIDAAERRGDKQAAKEMRVFLRRLEKNG